MNFVTKTLAVGLWSLSFLSHAQQKFAETITAADLKKHLSILAADDMQGRETGTPGQRKAAEYIAGQFAANGLKALVKADDGKPSYQQPFTLYKKKWGEFYLSAGGKRFNHLSDFVTNGLLSVPTETSYETVFVGYGISDSTAAVYNDYANRDVNGKAVVMLEGEPKTADGKPRFGESSKWSGPMGWRAKWLLAKQKGVAQIFIVSAESAEAFRQVVSQRKAMQDRFNRLDLRPGTQTYNATGVFLISADLAAALLNTSAATFQQVADQLAQSARPLPSSLSGKVSLRAELVEEQVQSSNVLGYIEGTDKKDEVLIVSAHYDHIGVSADGQVNNGANDDGSGTVSVLEIAQAFAQAKAAGQGPRRSLLFLTVSGEEKGLLGSQYYADISPVVPLANTVCDLNIDMVGRVDDIHEGKSNNYIYVIGSDKLSSDLHKISEATNQKYIGMNLDYTYNDPQDPQKIYYRSDHYNFAKHRIPIIFYFNGLHADYHKPTDDVEKIDFNLAERSARLVFYTAWEVANRDERLVVDSNKQ